MKGVHEVSFSTLANFAWEVSDKTTMNYNFLNSQAAEDEARHLSGELQEQFGLDSDTIYETYVLHYTERSLQNHQFKVGKFSGLGDLESNWVTSWAKTTQDEPDLRFLPLITTPMAQMSRFVNLSIALLPDFIVS